MRRYAGLVLFGIIVTAASLVPLAGPGPGAPVWPGYKGNGVTLLPNGWRIAPEGRHVTVGDLPMNVVPSPDGRTLAISSSGYSKPAIVLFDTRTLQAVGRTDVDHTWLGLVWHPDGRKMYASGASDNVIREFSLQNGRLVQSATITLGPAERHPGGDVIENPGYVAGMALSADGQRLYAALLYGEKVQAIDLAQKKVVATADLDAEPYTVLLSPDGQTLFASVWGGSKIAILDAATLEKKGEIPVGEHPNAMVMTRDGARLFVACGNTNAVWA